MTLLYNDFIVNIYTIGLGTSFYNLLVPLHTHLDTKNEKTNTLSWIFKSASSLKQQSVGRYVFPLGHIVLILRQPVLAFPP